MVSHFAAIPGCQIIIICRMQYAMHDIKCYLLFKITVFAPLTNSFRDICTDKKFQSYITRKNGSHIIQITECNNIRCPAVPDIITVRLCHCFIVEKDHVQDPVFFNIKRCQRGGIFNKSLYFCPVRPSAALWQQPRISRFHLHFRCFRLYDMQCGRAAY